MPGLRAPLVQLGLTVEQASHCLSRNPADYLGETDRGRLAVGAWADIVVLNQDLELEAVFIEGEAVPL